MCVLLSILGRKFLSPEMLVPSSFLITFQKARKWWGEGISSSSLNVVADFIVAVYI